MKKNDVRVVGTSTKQVEAPRKKLGIAARSAHEIRNAAGCGMYWQNLCGARQGG